jgi:hypothetical protein
MTGQSWHPVLHADVAKLASNINTKLLICPLRRIRLLGWMVAQLVSHLVCWLCRLMPDRAVGQSVGGLVLESCNYSHHHMSITWLNLCLYLQPAALLQLSNKSAILDGSCSITSPSTPHTQLDWSCADDTLKCKGSWIKGPHTLAPSTGAVTNSWNKTTILKAQLCRKH